MMFLTLPLPVLLCHVGLMVGCCRLYFLWRGCYARLALNQHLYGRQTSCSTGGVSMVKESLVDIRVVILGFLLN